MAIDMSYVLMLAIVFSWQLDFVFLSGQTMKSSDFTLL